MCGNLSKSRSSAIKYKIIPIKIKIGILLNNISGINDIKKQIIIKKYSIDESIFGIFVQIEVIIIDVNNIPKIVPNKAHPQAPCNIHKNIGNVDVASNRWLRIVSNFLKKVSIFVKW